MVKQLVWGLLLISTWAGAVEIDVGVDQNPIGIDESFTLIFRSTSSPDDDPDFSPLDDGFEVLSQQKKQQMSWVNGESNHVNLWVLKLMAKRVGKQEIPSISFGDDETEPLPIIVNEAAANQPLNSNNTFFLQAEVVSGKAYVQSQILYTVRFYRRVQLAQAGLSELKVDDAVVEKLGEERSYNKRLNGVEYAVSELNYAIFPQKSGRLKIPQLALTAQVLMDRQQSRYNSYFNRLTTQTRRIYSNSIELDVLPVPDSLKNNHWLPAEELVLDQQWSNAGLQIEVGEPITRTITLKAKGVTVSQLPELMFSENSRQLKTYPDKPLQHDEKTADGMTAVFQQKIAYIPSAIGDFKLPAIEVPWFNRQTQKMEKAILPAITLVAIAGEASAVIKQERQQSSQEEPQNVESQHPQDQTAKKPESSGWKWLSLFLATGWLITVLFLFWREKENPEKGKVLENRQPDSKEALKAIQQACLENDPDAARKALIEWGEIKYGATRFEQLRTFLNPALQAELNELNQSLYSPDCSGWNGEKLMQLVQEASDKREKSAGEGDRLEPLYRG